MKTNLGSLITSIDPNENIGDQQGVIDSWEKVAGTIYIHCDRDTAGQFGVVYVDSKTKPPRLKDVLVNHLSKVRGRETIGLCMPNILIKPDFSPLFGLIDEHRIQMSWAFNLRVTPYDRTPSMFIITTSVVPHMAVELTNDVLFTGTGWAEWVHDWLTKRMQVHRYLDGTQYNLIEAPRIELQAIAPEVEPEVAPEPPKPVKRKRKKRKAK